MTWKDRKTNQLTTCCVFRDRVAFIVVVVSHCHSRAPMKMTDV